MRIENINVTRKKYQLWRFIRFGRIAAVRYVFILSLLCLLVSGCKGVFGFSQLPGDHWRIVLGAGDPPLTSESAAQIGIVFAERLNLTLHDVMSADNKDMVKDVNLSAPSGAGQIGLLVKVDRDTSEIDLESRYTEQKWFGNNPNELKIEQDMSQKVLPILKELYPHSTAISYTRYAGPLGP